MSPLAAKILIVGIPMVISVSWFMFWVLRLTRAVRRKQLKGSRRSSDQPPQTDK